MNTMENALGRFDAPCLKTITVCVRGTSWTSEGDDVATWIWNLWTRYFAAEARILDKVALYDTDDLVKDVNFSPLLSFANRIFLNDEQWHAAGRGLESRVESP